MEFVFANNVKTTLAAAATSTQTTLTLSSSANLPSAIPSGSYFALTLNDAATGTVFEIVYVTAISGANVTCLRGQEGTGANAWSVGDYVYASNTAGILSSFANESGNSGIAFKVLTATTSTQAVPLGQLQNQTLALSPTTVNASGAVSGTAFYIDPSFGLYNYGTNSAVGLGANQYISGLSAGNGALTYNATGHFFNTNITIYGGAGSVNGYGIFSSANNSSIVCNSNSTASLNYANNAYVPHNAANGTSGNEVVNYGQFTRTISGQTFITELPNGTIEQCFIASGTTGGSGSYGFTVNLPESFPTGGYNAIVAFFSNVPVPGACAWNGTISATQVGFNVNSDTAATYQVVIWAKGY